MNSSDVRQKYLKFFEEKGHKVLPSSSLIPENDPTTLFTGSGMQPLLPYLLGETHPEGEKLVDSQKCFRSQDIEEVGDNRHTTFFEMLGNWSLGSYFKAEQLPFFFEFLTDQVGLDPHKLYVTVFIGDQKLNLPKDTDSAEIWKNLFSPKGIDAKEVEIGSEADGYKKGMSDGRIFYYDSSKNWWSRSGVPEKMPAGEPGGPDSEVFYDFGTPHNKKFGENCHPNCDCGRFLEIGNSVFMQFIKQDDESFKELPKKNVDFGGGLERITAVSNNEPDVFKTDLFWPIIENLQADLNVLYGTDEKITLTLRIVADHIKAATFLIRDGVLPSNKLQGYVLRRLLRRAAVKLELLREDGMSVLPELALQVYEIYKSTDYLTLEQAEEVKLVIKQEIDKFRNTLGKGLKEADKRAKLLQNEESAKKVLTGNLEKYKLSLDQFNQKLGFPPNSLVSVAAGTVAFDLQSTYGLPPEEFINILEEKNIIINSSETEKSFEVSENEHKELSRTTSAGLFKGGLADQQERTTKLHTANHLLQAALRQVVGEHLGQRGSNITAERLRFDFNNDEKLTDEQLKQVEDLVNEKIQEDLKVWYEIKDKEQAIKEGALSNYGENYPEKVKVYAIGSSPVILNEVKRSEESLSLSEKKESETSSEILLSAQDDKDGKPFSKELCGGPHVEHTAVLGKFKILKQESVSAGIKRIYATVE